MIIDSIRRLWAASAIGVVAAIGAVLVVLSVGVLSVGASARAGAHTATPSLRAVHRFPLTIRGYGFQPHRRVKVTLTAGSSTTRRPVAGRHGGFTVTFGTTPDRCTSWFVSASQRHRVPVVLHGALPECAPASAP